MPFMFISVIYLFIVTAVIKILVQKDFNFDLCYSAKVIHSRRGEAVAFCYILTINYTRFTDLYKCLSFKHLMTYKEIRE